MNTWKNITENKHRIDFTEMKATNFRFPKSLRRLMEEDLMMMKYEENDYISFNEFALLLMIQGAGYEFDEKTKKFVRPKDQTSLYNYYEYLKEREGEL